MDRIIIKTSEDRDAICDWVLQYLNSTFSESDVVPFIPPFPEGELVIIPDEAMLRFRDMKNGDIAFQAFLAGNNDAPMFTFTYNYSNQRISDKWFNPKLLDVEKAARKEIEWDYCQRFGILWFAVMLMASYYRPEFDRRKQVVGERKSPKKKGKGGKASSKMLYVRSYEVDAEFLDEIPRPVRHRRGPDHEFDVRGHYRRYKSGKVVWIKSYAKCKGRGERRDREYVAKVRGDS